MATAMNPSRQVNGRSTSKSHAIKEIIVDQGIANESGKPILFGGPTPRRRGDGYHFFEEDKNDKPEPSRIRNPKAKRRNMVDPPGFHDIIGDSSRSKHKGRKDPETAASIHRRRKRVIEQRAKNIMGGSREPMKHRTANMDGTEETASMSESWVPTRRIDKDPKNKPVQHYVMKTQMSRETMEIRDRAVPQRPWRPERQLSNKRSTLLEADDMDFSPTNEWVPSEFYRKRNQPQQAMQIFPTGTPHVVSSHATNEKAQYQEYLQQQRQRQYLQHQIQLQQELEAQKLQYQETQKTKSSWRPHRLPQQPPSIIHTITTTTTPSEPTTDHVPSLVHTTTTGTTPSSTRADADMIKRKSMESELDLSDVVPGSGDSDTMNGSFKPRNRDPQDSITNADSIKNKYLFNKSFGDLSKESSTIQESLVSWEKSKKGWFDNYKAFKEPEENSTVLDSIKKKNEASWIRQQPSSLRKIINNEYTFENTPEDDGFDESLLSASLTQLDIPQTFVIPTIFIRKSGESDITFDMDATRQAIESTITMSDEDVTWGSTLHNSIISQEDAAIAAAAAMAKEIHFGGSKDSKTPDTAGAIDSIIGSGTSGFTGRTLALTGITESGVSGLTNSGIMGNKDAFGSTVPDKLADEIGARARKKMADIPSEVSSYVEDTLSQNRSQNKQDSEGDDRSSWHHRSNITIASTMVSTKKMGNKKSKFKPRRSSTSTLPSIGSIIPEETWNYGDDDNFDEDEEEDDDDEESIYEIEVGDSDESSNSTSVDDIEEADLTGKLSSILEVASRDMSKTNSRDMSRTNSREFSVSSSRDLESGDGDNANRSNDSSDDDDTDKSSSNRNRNRSLLDRCACLDIRCFDRNRDGSRGRFNPTMGVYVLVFLLLLLLSVWVGIGVVWYRTRQPE